MPLLNAFFTIESNFSILQVEGLLLQNLVAFLTSEAILVPTLVIQSKELARDDEIPASFARLGILQFVTGSAVAQPIFLLKGFSGN